jgi:hypothetical protein
MAPHNSYHSRQPREFGVPSENLEPRYEPMGFLQTGLYPATSINILQQQQQAEAAEAAKKHATDEARALVAINAEWDRDTPYGSIVKPKHDTLRGYKYILKQGGGVRDVQFSPRDYGIFDGIIAKQGGIDADSRKYLSPAFNRDHPHYEDYAPLRRNIAILRNYLLVTMLPNGKGDGRNYAVIQQMASKLGTALAGGEEKPSFIQRWFHSVQRLLGGQDMSTPEANAFRKAANVPDQGIATMYNYLFERRNTPVSFFPNPVKYLMSKPWELIPIEQTPFSESNMLMYSRATSMEGIANAFENVVTQLQSVETLSENDKKISVDEARNILEKLRITLGNAQEESNVDVIEDSKQKEAEMMLRAAMAFKDAAAGLAKIDANLLKEPMIMDAMDALVQMDYCIKMEAMEAENDEGRTDAAKTMAARIATTPKRPNTQPIGTLVNKLKTGLNEVARLSQNSSARTAGVQIRAAQTARQKQTPAQQAVHTGSTMFSAGTKVKQVSNPSFVTIAQKANEQEPPTLTPQKGGLGGPSVPGRKL